MSNEQGRKVQVQVERWTERNSMHKGWRWESPHVRGNWESFHSALDTSGKLIGSEVENEKTKHEDTCMLRKEDLISSYK